MEPTYATRWFAQHLGQIPSDAGDYFCAVCGLTTSRYVPLASVLRDTFTDFAALRRRESGVCCVACAWYFDHQELRRSSWWLTGSEARSLTVTDARDLLLSHLASPPDEAGYYLFSLTNRKHLALYAPLNLPRSYPRLVRFESATLILTPSFTELLSACELLRQHHAWSEIESDIYNASALTRWSGRVERFVAARQAVQPWLRTPHLGLARFLLRGSDDGREHTDSD